MFGNDKKDPLVDAVSKVMQENQLRRDVERQVNETYGIHSKKALPFEHHAEYDRVLAEKTQQALSEGWSMKKEELVGNQHKIDANKNGKVDGQDFKILKARKGLDEEDAYDLDRYLVKDGKAVKDNPKAGAEKDGPNHVHASSAEHAMKKFAAKKKMDEASSSDPDFGAPRPDGSKKPGDIEFKPAPDSNDRGPAMTKEPPVPLPPKRPPNLKEAKYSAKAARAGEDIGKPGKNFEKIAQKAGERYGSKERGEKVAGAILAKIRAKHMEEETISEKAPEGAKFERMVKHIKDKYSKDGKLTDKEKSIAYATAWKAKNKDSE
jgi:hypothetical protein